MSQVTSVPTVAPIQESITDMIISVLEHEAPSNDQVVGENLKATIGVITLDGSDPQCSIERRTDVIQKNTMFINGIVRGVSVRECGVSNTDKLIKHVAVHTGLNTKEICRDDQTCAHASSPVDFYSQWMEGRLWYLVPDNESPNDVLAYLLKQTLSRDGEIAFALNGAKAITNI